jgi:hypothetical protein
MSLEEALDRYRKGGRLSAAQSGYMELVGAVKDADCRKVEVKGGVSKELGCCNEFQPEAKTTKKFSCGTCENLKPK